VSAKQSAARAEWQRKYWIVAAALLCAVSAAYGQTTSLDREVKATPGREVRVGIYTSMRPCGVLSAQSRFRQ
jgi:hypothetical protein